MVGIHFPEPDFRIKKENDRTFIFDKIRKAWILLTEEEWVRQNFVNYMVKLLNYPVSVIALEKEIKLNELRKRFDILIYDHNHKPWMLVECKAPEIKLSENVLQQVLRYNITVPVTYIIITNGAVTTGWKKENEELKLLDEMPPWLVT